MNCLDNLEKCNASCCKVIVFNTELEDGAIKNVFNIKYLSTDKLRYYLLHKCEVKRLLDRSWEVRIQMHLFTNVKITMKYKNMARIEIPLDCSELNQDNKCNLHKTTLKPEVCKLLNEETSKSEKILITKGCIYG